MVFAKKKVLVFGAGVSGISVAQTLQDLGAEVTLYDRKSQTEINKNLMPLTKKGVKLILGQEKFKPVGYDYLILSPGISINHPLVREAGSSGTVVMSEVEAAYRLCHAPLVAITGTNGKTTTTTLVGEMLKTTGKKITVGGNIGAALSTEVLDVDESGWVVAEISSFQLEGVISFAPHIAAILNITPDHIDRHGSFDNYKHTKERIFMNQKSDDYLILNYDDNVVREMGCAAPSQVVYFSSSHVLDEGFFVKDNNLQYKWKNDSGIICSINEMKLFGRHNVENALAACACAFFSGVKVADMKATLKTFSGVEHRIEFVKSINGVQYYNDSKATNPESTIKALEAFSGNIILIAGGRDKMTDLTQLMTLVKQKVDELILLGEAKERFYEAAVKNGVEHIHKVDRFEDSIVLANKLARMPQVVLLSPACASYDMFRSYEERGRVFKKLVHAL